MILWLRYHFSICTGSFCVTVLSVLTGVTNCGWFGIKTFLKADSAVLHCCEFPHIHYMSRALVRCSFSVLLDQVNCMNSDPARFLWDLATFDT
jgi:hypothetical protein